MYIVFIYNVHVVNTRTIFFTSNIHSLVKYCTDQPGLSIDVHVHAMLLHLGLFNEPSLKKPLVFLARVI